MGEFCRAGMGYPPVLFTRQLLQYPCARPRRGNGGTGCFPLVDQNALALSPRMDVQSKLLWDYSSRGTTAAGGNHCRSALDRCGRTNFRPVVW